MVCGLISCLCADMLYTISVQEWCMIASSCATEWHQEVVATHLGHSYTCVRNPGNGVTSCCLKLNKQHPSSNWSMAKSIKDCAAP